MACRNPNAAFECPVQKVSFERMDHLRQLQNIIQATSREIMWINDCEEEELLYDWSDKNTNIAQKQEAFSVSLSLSSRCSPGGGDERTRSNFVSSL